MKVKYSRPTQRRLSSLTLLLCLVTTLALAQTKIVVPKNKYSPAQDVELGRQAAAEAEKQLPILRDRDVESYVSDIGRRLVSAVPSEFQQREFQYYFKVVDASDINAFALPGGPMYVNRGMIQSARSEAEVAGVMAHELSHVVLRHGTAQATKAQKYQIGAVAGAIAGAILGGTLGNIVSEGSQFGIGAAFLKFTREYEKQADLLGVQIMARAGYDPRAMASMFETISKQGGGRGGPEWLSSHPDPGNRIQYINKEASTIRIDNPIRVTRDFSNIQSRLGGMPRARTMEEIARSGQQQDPRAGGGYPQDSRVGGRVEAPSSRYRSYNEGDLFQVSVPENWRELPSGNTVTFAPEGGYGQIQGNSIFTHGVQIGVTRNETHDLRSATEELIQGFAQGNPRLTRPSNFQRAQVAQREGLMTVLGNVRETDGRNEVVVIYTTQMSDGNLFWLVGVAPEDEYRPYQSHFQKVARSIRLNDNPNRRN
ncbi:MAG: M48 family metalloprotease [Acidobacteriota bacterium]